MKSKYGFLSAAFVASSILLGSGQASAGDDCWWGRAGFSGAVRVREILACVDDFTGDLRLAIHAPRALRDKIIVSADLWGAAECLYPALPLLPPVGFVDDCGVGFLPPALPPILPLPGGVVVPPQGRIDTVYFDAIPTYDELAFRMRDGWYETSIDLVPLAADACYGGVAEELDIDKLVVYIDGWPFRLNYNPPACAGAWW
ncbi:MAG: hypothetical protein IPM54_05210 [Polyangiaceae bacterium]|nr:hypothetical protein [Polyangiaceae bacterium]